MRWNISSGKLPRRAWTSGCVKRLPVVVECLTGMASTGRSSGESNDGEHGSPLLGAFAGPTLLDGREPPVVSPGVATVMCPDELCYEGATTGMESVVGAEWRLQ